MSIRRKLTLAFIATVYALIFGEVFTRVLAPEPLLPRNVTGSEWGIRQNIPNAFYWQTTRDVTVPVKINSQGLRADVEYAKEPAADTCRIAITGDSYFFGYESTRENSIGGLLDGELEKRGFRTETLNFSVSGFGNAETVLQFERRIAQFMPEITVFQFHETDLDDNVRSGLFALDENGELVQMRDTYLPGVSVSDALMKFPPYRWADAHSQLFAALRKNVAPFIKRTLVAMQSAAAVPDDGSVQEEEASATQAKRNLARALLLRSRELTHDANSDWYVFEVPRQRSAEKSGSQLDALGLPVRYAPQMVSPVQQFMGRDDLNLPHGHHHFTLTGNAISAQVLADRIVSESRKRLAECGL